MDGMRCVRGRHDDLRVASDERAGSGQTAVVERIERDAQEKVEHQDRHERIDERRGGGPADPFGPGLASESRDGN